MDPGAVVTVIVLLVLIGGFITLQAVAAYQRAHMTPEQRLVVEEAVKKWREARKNRHLGDLNPALFCPHCQTTGSVRVKPVIQKSGISGAKATGAVLTGGLSVLATGLSQKENKTQAHCDNCGSIWIF